MDKTKLENEAPYCPKHPKTKMILKKGKWGWFWSCPEFPKCKESATIPIHLELATYSEIFEMDSVVSDKSIDYFLTTEVYRYIENFKEFYELTDAQERTITNTLKLINDRTIFESIYHSSVAGTIDLLRKKKKFFYATAFIFFLYKVNGKLGPKWIDSSWNFWLNSRSGTTKPFKHWHIQEAIKNADEDHHFFKMVNIKQIQLEYETRYGKADIVGIEQLDDSRHVIVELKTKKHREGIDQVLRYRDDFKRSGRTNIKCYVIATGYPEQYIDNLVSDGNKEKVGLLSYIVQENEILFIPWKKAGLF